MTPELKWLTYTALLVGSLWIPYVIGVNTTDFPGKSQQFTRPPDHSQMKLWVHRSFRAQQNVLEQFVPFAAIVLVAAVSHVSTPVTVGCCIAFFWVRVAHAIGMISGLARFPLRPMIYFAGWLVMLLLAWQVLSRAA
ncbi:MAG TPA: MAPEG family protein [Steroidobacteraceae bacterium]